MAAKGTTDWGDKPKIMSKDIPMTPEELAHEQHTAAEEKREAAEAEARAKVKAAEEEVDIKNRAEKEADKLKMEGGEPIKSVAGAPTVTDPKDTRPSQSPTGSLNASATNPALAANDAVPTPALADVDEAAIAEAKSEGKLVVPLHPAAA